jgi:hypothetical protein
MAHHPKMRVLMEAFVPAAREKVLTTSSIRS